MPKLVSIKLKWPLKKEPYCSNQPKTCIINLIHRNSYLNLTKRHLSTLLLLIISIFAVLKLTSGRIVQDEQDNGRLKKLTLNFYHHNSTGNVTEPLRYTRLKYDYNHLPMMRNLHKKYSSDEIESDQIITSDGRIIKSSNVFYTNEAIDIRNISEDDLILEALDQTYLTRFTQPYLSDYDHLEDRRQSSDSKLINKNRCLEELGYLYDQLNELELARANNNFPPNNDSNTANIGRTRLHPELATLLDSYGGSESGALLGNYNWLGQWDQCSLRHIFDFQQLENSTNDNDNNQNNANRKSGKFIDFFGRSCIVSIRNPKWDSKILVKTRKLNKSNYFIYPKQHLDYQRFFRFQIGVCLPESCDSNILMDKLMSNDTYGMMIRKLALHKVQEPYRQYNLTNIYCLPDESSPMRKLNLSGWLFVLVTISWLLSMLMATIIDLYDLVGLRKLQAQFGNRFDKNFAQKLIISLSLIENYRTLAVIGGLKRKQQKGAQEATSGSGCNQAAAAEKTKTNLSQAKPADLTFLHSIKVLIMWPILAGHVSMITLLLCKYPLDWDGIPRIVNHLLTASSFYVDWYFCITALITTYSMFATKAVWTNTPVQWLYSIFHRYWRMMPLYLYVFWFARSIFKFTGSGALWDYGTSSLGFRDVCQRESWLVPLTLTPNFHPIHQECIMPAWYIGADMQFYLVSQVILFTLSKSAKLGWLLALSILMASNSLRLHRYLTDERVRPIDLMRPRIDLSMRNNWDLYQTYLYPQYRIGSYMVGTLVGHYIYMVRSGQWSSPLYYISSSSSTTGSGGGVESTGSGVPTNQFRINDYITASRLRSIVGLTGIWLAIIYDLSCWWGDELFTRSMERHAKEVAAVLYANTFTLVSLAPSLLSMALMFGWWPQLKAKLEHPFWIYLSRLNFFVFLLQVEAVVWVQQSAHRMPETLLHFEIQMYALVKPMLYLISFILTVMMANPLARLETEFLGVYMMPRRPNRVKDSNHREQNRTEAAIQDTSLTTQEAAHLVEMTLEENGEDKFQQQQQPLEYPANNSKNGRQVEVAAEVDK